MADAYLIDGVRSPFGRHAGVLASIRPDELVAQTIAALLARHPAAAERVEEVVLGCTNQAGEDSRNVARFAALLAGLPERVGGVTVNRLCASGLQSVVDTARAVKADEGELYVAGGVESMTRVPMGLPATLPFKHGFGSYMSPALQARYPGVQFSQFMGAELLAKKYELSKDALDRYALQSHRRAAAATREGRFEEEIVPVEVRNADGVPTGETHAADEGIRFDASLEAIAAVKLLQEGSRITAATSSQICDGAAALLVANERGLKTLGHAVKPLAIVRQMTVVGHDPVVMLEGPVPATPVALRKAGLKIDDIDLFEVNEAFASVPLAWLKATGADPARLNVNGGAIALGHPLGASGAKLMTTLVHALAARGARYGLQTMCEGGGLANVTIVERV